MNADALLRAIFPEEMARREEGKCPFCGEEVKPRDFRDLLSVSEFEISGLCQKCQDDTFGR